MQPLQRVQRFGDHAWPCQTCLFRAVRVGVRAKGRNGPAERQRPVVDGTPLHHRVEGVASEIACHGLAFRGADRIIGAVVTYHLPFRRLSIGLAGTDRLEHLARRISHESICRAAGQQGEHQQTCGQHQLFRHFP